MESNLPTDVLTVIETFTQDRMFGIYPKTRKDYQDIMLLTDKKIRRWNFIKNENENIIVIKNIDTSILNDHVDTESSELFDELFKELTDDNGNIYINKLKNVWSDQKFKYITKNNTGWTVYCDQPRLLQNVISEKISFIEISKNAKNYDIGPEIGRIPFYRKRKLFVSQILLFKLTFGYEKRIENEHYKEHISITFKHYKPHISTDELSKKPWVSY